MAVHNQKMLVCRTLTNTKVTALAVADGTVVLMHNILLFNLTAAAATVKLYIHDGANERQIYEVEVASKKTETFSFENEGLVLLAGQSLLGESSAASSVNCLVMGSEKVGVSGTSGGASAFDMSDYNDTSEDLALTDLFIFLNGSTGFVERATLARILDLCLLKSGNLEGLSDVAAARGNLGLTTGVSAGNVPVFGANGLIVGTSIVITDANGTQRRLISETDGTLSTIPIT